MNKIYPSDLSDGEWKYLKKRLPKRWIVERTFAWLSKQRRLSKDYESLCDTSEAMVHIAMIRLMPAKLDT
jgi:transposase